MHTFYEYEMITTHSGDEIYLLRANCKTLGPGKFCVIDVHVGDDGKACYVRTTQWGAKPGRRTENFSDLDLAMRSGIDWAIRRTQEDRRNDQ
jgi:hypothetical protein